MTGIPCVILFILANLIFLVGLLFVILVLPIWAIIDCATSKEKSNGSRIFWLIFMPLTWSLGALIYGMFASTKKSLRWTCILTIIVGTIYGVGFMFLMNWTSSALTKEINQAEVQLKTVDTTALRPGEIETLKANLTTLSQETHYNIHKRDQGPITADLFEYYQLIVKDNKIDSQEYGDWHQKFELRNALKEEEIKKAIQQKKSNRNNVTP